MENKAQTKEKKDNNNKKPRGEQKKKQEAKPKYNDTEEAKKQLENMRQIEEKMKEVQQKLGQLHSKGKEIDRKVKLTLKDKKTAEERVEGLLKRIEKLKAERTALEATLKEAMDVVETRRVAEAKAKQGLLKQRKKNEPDEEFVNSCLLAIEEEVKNLNLKLENSNGSVAEERKILKEMQRVRSTKNQIPVYLQRSRAYQEARGNQKRAQRDLESKDSFIKTLEKELEELRGEIAALDGKEQAEQKPVKDALSTEEQQLRNELNDLYTSMKNAKDSYSVNRDKWHDSKWEKKRQAAEKVAEKREREKQLKEDERKKVALAERLEKKTEIPYQKEIKECTALLLYLDSLLPSSTASEPSAVSGATGAAAENSNNGEKKAVAPSNIRKQEEDDWGSFAATKKKGKKAQANKNKKAPKFVINMQTIDQFRQQGFPAPMSLEQVPELRKTVAAKLEEHKTKSENERAQTLAQIAEEEEKERLAEKDKESAADVKKPEGVEESKEAKDENNKEKTAEEK